MHIDSQVIFDASSVYTSAVIDMSGILSVTGIFFVKRQMNHCKSRHQGDLKIILKWVRLPMDSNNCNLDI